jgi:fused signal recognition particle receptor
MKLKLQLGQKLRTLFGTKRDRDEVLSDIEELLITADFGVDFTMEIIDELGNSLQDTEPEQVINRLKTIIKERMSLPAPTKPAERNPGLNVFLLFGVNGTGKTTTAGKLAFMLKKEGQRVLIAAADTYRDAAIEQLSAWSKRANVPLVRQQQGADPGAVVYDACDAAQGRKVESLIIDTAGRLHNKERLMEELAKIGRVLEKKLPDAHTTKMLILDATTGQNALSQAALFNEYIGVDGIILTKLDSSAKGGIACAVSGKLKIPLVYAGVGEKVDDLIDFEVDGYLHELFG